MAPEADGDLDVDVLIIGGGLQALFIARALYEQYSVCVVVDPENPSETLDSPGYFSAGYTGNDVSRIQPARRAAGYWRQWAESNEVPHYDAPVYYVMPPDEEDDRTRLWADATLRATAAASLPEIFAEGSLTHHPAYLIDSDVAMNPTHLVAKMSEGLGDRIVSARVTKFGVITDKAIDFVAIQGADERVVPITPRFVVLAANVGNGALMQRLVTGFKDRVRRKEAVEIMHGCQAVRRRTTIVARGDLPMVAGHFEGLDIAAHPIWTGSDTVWIINPPIDDSQTVLGPEEVRFQPKVEPSVVVAALDRLFAASPALRRMAPSLRWGAYVARKTEHPVMAAADTSGIGQPAPARLETLDMQGFLAVWPSHLSFAMIAGDVVAERVATALGDPVAHTTGLGVSSLGQPLPQSRVAQWERPGFEWRDWSAFAGRFGYPSG
jgi:hypothetical protein